jgi:glutathione S-transferase
VTEPETPILFHYPMSPYSEKLRLALGIYRRQWLSFEVAAFPPRPLLNRLTGGYRRIPVLQLGAHLYCDSRLAIRALRSAAPRYRNGLSEDQALCRTAEEVIFFSVIASAPPRGVIWHLMKEVGIISLPGFLRDRATMMTQATVKPPSRAHARDQIKRFTAELAQRLDSQDFLDGSEVGLTDLCCYHPLWMAAKLNKSFVETLPDFVSQWMARIRQFGHGTPSIASESLVRAAIDRDRQEVSAQRIEVMPFERYQTIDVAPSDYARDAVQGQLIKLDSLEIIIRRPFEETGRLYLHFPREGFDVRAA